MRVMKCNSFAYNDVLSAMYALNFYSELYEDILRKGRKQATIRLGASLPLVRLWPDSPVLALRAELALKRYGLKDQGLDDQALRDGVNCS